MNNSKEKPMPKLAVLVSGTGSILKAILEYPLKVDLVIADCECLALQIAREAGIQIILIPRTFGASFTEEARDSFSLQVAEALKDYGSCDIVAMAGFGTILSPIFFSHFGGQLLNTHPSLLPLFKGHRAVRQALIAGATKTGCTVHRATPKLDDEEFILGQAEVPILEDDTEEVLHERIKEVERVLYPRTIAGLLSQNL